MRYARTDEDYQAIGVEPQIGTTPKSITLEDADHFNMVVIRSRSHAEDVIQLIRDAVEINEW